MTKIVGKNLHFSSLSFTLFNTILTIAIGILCIIFMDFNFPYDA